MKIACLRKTCLVFVFLQTLSNHKNTKYFWQITALLFDLDEMFILRKFEL